MLFLLGLLVIAAVGFTAMIKVKNDGAKLLLGFGAGLVSLAFLIGVIMVPVSRMYERATIVRCKEFVETLKRTRQKGTLMDHERADVQREITGINCWIAEIRYWNGTIFDLWHLDEVDDLKPLE